MIIVNFDLSGLDTKILLFLNRLGNEKWDALWLFITNQHAWWWFYLLLFAFLIYQWGWKRGLMASVILILALILNDQMINFIKNITQRPRPCNVESLQHQLRILKCSPQYSFFSGHAANSFLVATFLWFSAKRKDKILGFVFLWALLTAYSRIYIGMHYPSDVITGIIEGILSGLLTGQFIKKKFLVMQQNSPSED